MSLLNVSDKQDFDNRNLVEEIETNESNVDPDVYISKDFLIKKSGFQI